MRRKRTSLGDDVFAAFERACKEGDLQIAEHLLQALETLDRRERAEGRMKRVYSDLIRILRSETQR
jgi:hypothetical protein